jgi:membrane-associated phospholipid phosphatase
MAQREKKMQWLWFGVAFVALLLACWLTPNHDINGKNTVDIFERMAHNLSHAINSVWVGLSLLMLLVPAAVRSFKAKFDATVWWVPSAIVVTVLVVDLIGKSHIHAPRPDGRPGFPSGHATFAFVLAWLVAAKYPKLAPLWYAIAVAISWSRIEIHAHFPYQVLGGALIGTLIGWSISHFLKDRTREDGLPASEAATGEAATGV